MSTEYCVLSGWGHHSASLGMPPITWGGGRAIQSTFLRICPLRGGEAFREEDRFLCPSSDILGDSAPVFLMMMMMRRRRRRRRRVMMMMMMMMVMMVMAGNYHGDSDLQLERINVYFNEVSAFSTSG
jgi:hypothetical protein